jgi:hypothetical protein
MPCDIAQICRATIKVGGRDCGGGATGLSRFIDLIDENGGGPTVRLCKRKIDGAQEPAELRTGGNCGSGPLLGY